MKPALAALLLLVAVGCASVKPVPIRESDACFRCKRPIADVKLAGEIVDANYRAYTFRTVSCLATYLNQHPEALKEIFVTNSVSGRLVPARSAMFVRIVVDPNTLERDYVAFGSVDEAVAFARQHGTEAVDWPTVMHATARAAAD